MFKIFKKRNIKNIVKVNRGKNYFLLSVIVRRESNEALGKKLNNYYTNTLKVK